MSEISKRIYQAIEKAGLSYGELSKITHIPKSALQRYATGQTPTPIDRLEKIAIGTGVKAGYLMGWIENKSVEEGISLSAKKIGCAYDKAPLPIKRTVEVALEPYIISDSNSNIEIATELAPELTEIRSYTQLSAAGLGNYIDDEDYELVSFPNVPKRANVAVKVSGDSMEPKYKDGDIVFVETDSVLNDGEIGIFNYDGQGYVKVLKTNPARLVSLNKKYEDIILNDLGDIQFHTIGRVVGVYRA